MQESRPGSQRTDTFQGRLQPPRTELLILKENNTYFDGLVGGYAAGKGEPGRRSDQILAKPQEVGYQTEPPTCGPRCPPVPQRAEGRYRAVTQTGNTVEPDETENIGS